MKVIGYYNELGYRVELGNKPEFYRAGNHALDSQQDATDSRHQLPLAAIQAMCEQTTRDIAEEENAEYAGIEYGE